MYRLLLLVILSAKLSEYNWFTFTRSPQTLYRPVMFTGISISSFSASTYICDMWHHMACTLESSSQGFSHCGPIVCSSMSVEFLWQADSGHLFGGISEPCVCVFVGGWVDLFCVLSHRQHKLSLKKMPLDGHKHTLAHTHIWQMLQACHTSLNEHMAAHTHK